MFAIENRRPAAVVQLLRANANREQPNMDNETPLQIAIRMSYDTVVEALKNEPATATASSGGSNGGGGASGAERIVGDGGRTAKRARRNNSVSIKYHLNVMLVVIELQKVQKKARIEAPTAATALLSSHSSTMLSPPSDGSSPPTSLTMSVAPIAAAAVAPVRLSSDGGSNAAALHRQQQLYAQSLATQHQYAAAAACSMPTAYPLSTTMDVAQPPKAFVYAHPPPPAPIHWQPATNPTFTSHLYHGATNVDLTHCYTSYLNGSSKVRSRAYDTSSVEFSPNSDQGNQSWQHGTT